jgi:hypothetical protein
MQLLKINKSVDSTTDLFKEVLFIYCHMNKMKISDSELTTMAYFIAYGFKQETIDLILKSKILNPSSLKNTLSKFRKYNFLKRVNKNDFLNEEFKFLPNKEIGLLLRITNEKY